MYMEEKKYLNKWIVFQPTYGFRMIINSVVVAYCFKETKKQVKYVENINNIGFPIFERTIPKSEILAIVSEDKIEAIREHAKRIRKYYKSKIERTLNSCKEAMLNFPR